VFDAVDWTSGRACFVKKWWWHAGMVICLEQSANDFGYDPTDVIATPSFLASLNSRIVYLSASFGAGLHTLLLTISCHVCYSVTAIGQYCWICCLFCCWKSGESVHPVFTKWITTCVRDFVRSGRRSVVDMSYLALRVIWHYSRPTERADATCVTSSRSCFKPCSVCLEFTSEPHLFASRACQ